MTKRIELTDKQCLIVAHHLIREYDTISNDALKSLRDIHKSPKNEIREQIKKLHNDMLLSLVSRGQIKYNPEDFIK